MEVFTKQEVLDLLKDRDVAPLLNRPNAAKFLDMEITTFDKFIRQNDHLKLKVKGSSPRYCPKALRNTFIKSNA